MNKIKVFCFGFGQVAKHFVYKLIKENQAIELNVTSRKKTQRLTFEGLDFNSYELNEKKIDKNMNTKILDANFVLVSIPPINTFLILCVFTSGAKTIDENLLLILIASARSFIKIAPDL